MQRRQPTYACAPPLTLPRCSAPSPRPAPPPAEAQSIASQALGNIRTVYAFNGEERTLETYAAALDEPVKVRGRAQRGGRGIVARERCLRAACIQWNALLAARSPTPPSQPPTHTCTPPTTPAGGHPPGLPGRPGRRRHQLRRLLRLCSRPLVRQHAHRGRHLHWRRRRQCAVRCPHRRLRAGPGRAQHAVSAERCWWLLLLVVVCAAIAAAARPRLGLCSASSRCARSSPPCLPACRYFAQSKAAGGRLREVMERTPTIDMDAQGGWGRGGCC